MGGGLGNRNKIAQDILAEKGNVHNNTERQWKCVLTTTIPDSRLEKKNFIAAE